MLSPGYYLIKLIYLIFSSILSCRECIRKEGWSDRVQLNRVSDHFIFTVESSGCIPPEVIVREAIGVLKQKAVMFHGYAEDSQREGEEL